MDRQGLKPLLSQQRAGFTHAVSEGSASHHPTLAVNFMKSHQDTPRRSAAAPSPARPLAAHGGDQDGSAHAGWYFARQSFSPLVQQSHLH